MNTKILLTCLLGPVFSHASAQSAAKGIPYKNGRVVGSERIEGEGSSQIFTFAPRWQRSKTTDFVGVQQHAELVARL